MFKKLPKVILIILVALISALVVFVSIISMTMAPLSIVKWIEPDPPSPSITYGEFPFKVEYELNGEAVTIEDIYICEFDGFSFNTGVGKHREWKGFVKETGEENLCLVKDGNLQLCFSIGYPEYYMGDLEYDSGEPYTPFVFYVIEPNEAGGQTSGADPNMIEELTAKHNLKIISWELSEPIKNTFN